MQPNSFRFQRRGALQSLSTNVLIVPTSDGPIGKARFRAILVSRSVEPPDSAKFTRFTVRCARAYSG